MTFPEELEHLRAKGPEGETMAAMLHRHRLLWVDAIGKLHSESCPPCTMGKTPREDSARFHGCTWQGHEVCKFKQQVEHRKNIARLDATDVPKKYVLELANLQILDRQALVAARAFIAGTRPVLVLAGPNDRGKTFAAAWALAKQGGRWLSYPVLTRARSHEEIERWKGCGRLLVIDEAGQGHSPSEYAKGLFEEIIGYREGNHRPDRPMQTLVTTNFTDEVFSKHFDERVTSRVFGASGTDGWCYVDGEPLRGRQLETRFADP